MYVWCNDGDRRILTYWEKNVSQCQFVDTSLKMKWSGIQPGPSRRDAGDYDTACCRRGGATWPSPCIWCRWCVSELDRKVNTLKISVRTFRLSYGSPVAGHAIYGMYKWGSVCKSYWNCGYFENGDGRELGSYGTRRDVSQLPTFRPTAVSLSSRPKKSTTLPGL